MSQLNKIAVIEKKTGKRTMSLVVQVRTGISPRIAAAYMTAVVFGGHSNLFELIMEMREADNEETKAELEKILLESFDEHYYVENDSQLESLQSESQVTVSDLFQGNQN